MDKNPIKGQKNIYTVRAYVVFSNTYGGYDPKGVSVNVPSKPTPHKHSYTSSITRQPTCSKEGVRTYKCSCGHSYTKSIPATRKHVWEDLGSDVRLDWSGSLQENTGPTQTRLKFLRQISVPDADITMAQELMTTLISGILTI